MSDNSHRRPKVWGRRPYADKEAREVMNDISRYIQRTRPADVEDPDDPTLSDILRHATMRPDADGAHELKAKTLTELMEHGLDFQEAICWYWFRYCRWDVTEVHYGIEGASTGGDAADRRNSVRNILSVLRSAASKIPDESEDDVPALVEDRKRHDRTDDTITAESADDN